MGITFAYKTQFLQGGSGLFNAVKHESQMHLFDGNEFLNLLKSDLDTVMLDNNYDVIIARLIDLDVFILLAIIVQSVKMPELFTDLQVWLFYAIECTVEYDWFNTIIVAKPQVFNVFLAIFLPRNSTRQPISK